MTFAAVGSGVSQISTNSNGFTTSAIDTTGADLIVAQLSYYVAGSASFSDSKGNTWTPLTSKSSTGNVQGQLYYCQGGTVGSGHTFTVTSTGGYPSVYVMPFSGSAASGFDVENGFGGGGLGSAQPGSITPSQDNELVIAGFGQDGSQTLSIDGGFAITGQFTTSGGGFGGAMAYLIQTSAAATNPTWSWPAVSMGVIATIASFKASGGGGGAPPSPVVPRSSMTIWY